MIPLPKTILVPLDFGAASRRALDYAVAIAKRLDARVHVIHAFEIPVVGFPDGVATVTAELASRIVDAAQKALKDAVAPFEHSGVVVTSALHQGDPREVIAETIKAQNVDLVVMGTHGRKGVVRALMGSVAERIVRTCPVPLLTVHADGLE
jgi:nucleotide-binding universal stress UspA family protein